MKLFSKLGFFGAVVLSAAMMACGSDGAQGPAGPQGAPGEKGTDGTSDPSVSAIVPNAAFLARKVEVTISGYGTKWANPTVDFGAGIKVDKIAVASPTALLVTISVDKTAAAGARDVTVTEGGSTSSYKGAFKVESPISVETVGTLAQGSILTLQVKNKDLANPFDLTTVPGGLFQPPVPVGVQGNAPGFTFEPIEVSLYSMTVFAIVDVTAPAGPVNLSFTSGVAGPTTDFTLPSAFTIGARTAVPLSTTAPTNGTMAKAGDSQLYSITPTAGAKLFEVTATSANPDADTFMLVFPKSGKFADVVTQGLSAKFVSDGTDPFYVVYYDRGLLSGYNYSISAPALAAAGSAAETADNNTFGNAQVASGLPFILKNATLSNASDEDWIKVTIAAGDVGKRIRVETVAGESRTDTAIEVFQADGTTSFAAMVDNSFHELLRTPAITAAGDYYVKISASPEFDPKFTKYHAVIRLE
jgi:hypothetical protein